MLNKWTWLFFLSLAACEPSATPRQQKDSGFSASDGPSESPDAQGSDVPDANFSQIDVGIEEQDAQSASDLGYSDQGILDCPILPNTCAQLLQTRCTQDMSVVETCTEDQDGCLFWTEESDCAAQAQICDDSRQPAQCRAAPSEWTRPSVSNPTFVTTDIHADANYQSSTGTALYMGNTVSYQLVDGVVDFAAFGFSESASSLFKYKFNERRKVHGVALYLAESPGNNPPDLYFQLSDHAYQWDTAKFDLNDITHVGWNTFMLPDPIDANHFLLDLKLTGTDQSLMISEIEILTTAPTTPSPAPLSPVHDFCYSDQASTYRMDFGAGISYQGAHKIYTQWSSLTMYNTRLRVLLRADDGNAPEGGYDMMPLFEVGKTYELWMEFAVISYNVNPSGNRDNEIQSVLSGNQNTTVTIIDETVDGVDLNGQAYVIPKGHNFSGQSYALHCLFTMNSLPANVYHESAVTFGDGHATLAYENFMVRYQELP